MTTLAIIGSGIAGRSLIYTLAKEKKNIQRVTLFCSDSIAAPCTLHSTAIVAPRGLSSGHSPLGDLLLESFHFFKSHVELDFPLGVTPIVQFTGTSTKLDAFKRRYPHATSVKDFLLEETLVAQDEGFMIEPRVYGDWLLSRAQELNIAVEVVHDFVTEVNEQGDGVEIKTASGTCHNFDKVVFAGGSYNRFWKESSSLDSPLQFSKAVQGSYLEFNHVLWDRRSFSLTLDGDNLVWNQKTHQLLIGSTSLETHHLMPPMRELSTIYDRLQGKITLPLPLISSAKVRVGIREKARKRSPYIFSLGKKIYVGGFYKNGFSLGLKIASDLSRRYL